MAAQAQGVDSSAFAVAFSGGDASGPVGVVTGVQLHVEVTDEQVANFRSMSLLADVDCKDGREKVRKANAFDLPDLAGPAQPRPVSGEWTMPEAYMREVIKTICTTHGLRFVEQVASAAPSPAMARAPTPSPEPPPAPTSSEAAPAPPTPEPVADSTPIPSPPPTPPAHEPAPAPATLASATGYPYVRSSTAILSSQARVQIASSPSRAEAEAMLSRSAAVIQPPLQGAVEVATVHGRTVYRSIIARFSSEAEAREFCARTRSSLDGCFVWAR